MSNLYGIIVSILYIGVILAASNLFSKVSKEASRKFIHIMLSNWWIIAMIFFTNMWCAAILPAIFVVVNYLSYKFNIIKSMERNEEEKDGLGTVYYALSLLILSLITFGPLKNPIIGLVGVAVMGYADGIAAIVGKSVNSPKFGFKESKKSLAGSAAMFVIALIIVSGALVYLNIGYWFVKALVISIISTAIEAVSIKGTDNITVPIITSLMIFLVL
jgi:phytol kinase